MNPTDANRTKGLNLPETIHSMKRRAPWHNYGGKGLYMITMVIDGRRPLLGQLLGDPHPHVELSPLGRQILSTEIPKIHEYYPNVEVWKSIVMPDHIHSILYVRDDFAEGRHLGTVISGFKHGCMRAYRQLYPGTPTPLFEKGYNDKILLHRERLDRWIRYLDDNPRRLWIKRNNPEYFTVLHDREIAGVNCQMIGNMFLLDIPDKEVVIYHRHYTDAELSALYRRYMGCGERGGVIVSAAIAPWEKSIMRGAMDKGYRLILLRDNGFPALYKPAGEAFDACAKGRLLQISPWPHNMQRTIISREKCLFLNKMGMDIAYGKQGMLDGKAAENGK